MSRSVQVALQALTVYCFILISSSAAIAQPRIVFSDSMHNFGTIEEGVQARHVFEFTNGGDEPLLLSGVQVTCGCTTPEWTNTPVAPGESGQVVVVFDSEGRPGPFRRSVRVMSNGEPALLYIQGTVSQLSLENGVAQGNVVFDSDRRNLGVVTSEKATARVRMQNKSNRPISITGANASDSNVSVAYPETPIAAGGIAELTVEISTGGLENGSRFDYSVVIDTSDELQPKKSLRFTGARGTVTTASTN